MKKFVAIFRVPVEVMGDWKKNTSPEDMKAQSEKIGAEMMAWMQKYDKQLVDKGLPLGKNTRLTTAGAQAVPNDMNFYCTIEAENIDEAVAILKEGSHLQIPQSYIDIMEVPHMGM
jgi:hypothetical protein